MKAKHIVFPEDDGSSLYFDWYIGNPDVAVITTEDSYQNQVAIYATPANLRAIAAACVEAADELEGKS